MIHLSATAGAEAIRGHHQQNGSERTLFHGTDKDKNAVAR